MGLAANARRFVCKNCALTEYIDGFKFVELCKRCGNEMEERQR